MRSERVNTSTYEHDPSQETHPLLVGDDEIKNEPHSEGSRERVDDVSKCAAQANNESPARSIEHSPSNAENSNRPYRSRQGETDREAFQKIIEWHGKQVAPGL